MVNWPQLHSKWHLHFCLSLFLALSFALITFALGINAIVKANKEKSSLKAAAPSHTVVNIDTNDIFSAGASATVAAGLTALEILVFATHPVVLRKSPSAIFTRRTHSITLAFLSVWLFASLVPFTAFYANRSAKVTAFVGSIQLPPQVIQQVQNSLGATPVYREKIYLRLFAIVPWFSLLFTAGASIVSWITHGSTTQEKADSPTSVSTAAGDWPILAEKGRQSDA